MLKLQNTRVGRLPNTKANSIDKILDLWYLITDRYKYWIYAIKRLKNKRLIEWNQPQQFQILPYFKTHASKCSLYYAFGFNSEFVYKFSLYTIRLKIIS